MHCTSDLMNTEERIALLDAGSQYGKVIDRRVRELNCYCELLPLESTANELRDYKGIIISGGPNSLKDKNAPRCDPSILDMDVPILGICYGMQWLNITCGGVVETGMVREDGQLDIQVDTNDPLFKGLDTSQTVLLTHGDSITALAENLLEIASSKNFPSAVKMKDKQIYGVQFHPEVDLTLNGTTILKNFLFDICKMKGTFQMEDRISKAMNEIKLKVQSQEVVVLVSGGVDSTVCYALLCKALGSERVHGFHVNTGFMRYQEDILVTESLSGAGFELEVIDACERFFNGSTTIEGIQTDILKNITSPEIKRKIIGDTFIKVILEEIEKKGLSDYYLAQGTLRPDLIESASCSASSKADVIKTHHNDTALVREKREKGLIIEPLKDYHKDEVRVLGKLLGLSDSIVSRHPFPGPGLAIRILCSDEPFITNDFLQIEQSIKEKIDEDDLKIKLLPIQSVGVQGDGRTYSYVCCLFGKPDWGKLIQKVKEITSNFHQINRVVYLLGSEKDVDTINETSSFSFTKTYLTEDVVDVLRKADFYVNDIFNKYDGGSFYKKISQFPVILIPISFDGLGKRSIVLRPFITNDFMTGVPAIPGVHLPLELVEKIQEELCQKISDISRVLLDLTSKPPGTTEWE